MSSKQMPDTIFAVIGGEQTRWFKQDYLGRTQYHLTEAVIEMLESYKKAEYEWENLTPDELAKHEHIGAQNMLEEIISKLRGEE